MHIDDLDGDALTAELSSLQTRYQALADRQLNLDLTRGKPCTEQVALSDALDGILAGNYLAADGTDARNYGGLMGLPEARELFGAMLNAPAEHTMVAGNSSLTLMYSVLEFALNEGMRGAGSAWSNSGQAKFICPVPGYDRHFSVCQHLGIEMVTVPMLDSGPDMDAVEQLVSEDPTIRGIWCVPRFSNPTGCVYSAETVERIARLGHIASEHFLVMWDNAYAVHSLSDDAPKLASIADHGERLGTTGSIIQFGSTSKITFAGAGVAFLASSPDNLAAFSRHLSFQSIGPDKVNQTAPRSPLTEPGTARRAHARPCSLGRPSI